MELDWPFTFILSLTDEEKQARRDSLDNHALVAHISAFIPAVIVLLVRLAVRLTTKASSSSSQGYQQIPGSPVVKAQRQTSLGDLKTRVRKWQWWLDDEVHFLGSQWGHRDEWLLGPVWFIWLFILCWNGTGKDYLHLTKRFGLVAASQLPIQYLLSLKSLNPFSYAFNTSHEVMNRYHRVLGRVVYLLLILHIIFYNIFFLKVGVWLKRFFAPIVFVGVVASFAMHALNSTAMRSVRRWSYRVFFVTHLMAAMLVPPLIFFHAPTARFYVVEALLVFILDLASRKTRKTVMAPSTLENIPGTNLLQIKASLPPSKAQVYHAQPGSHIYLSIPPASRPPQNLTSLTTMLYDFLYNPFTVATSDPETGLLTLIARTRAGPMTRYLSKIASSSTQESKISLAVEGPYGTAGKHFPALSKLDRVLLVAGGVGATFALPIYHAIIRDSPTTKVTLVWAVRTAADATWSVAVTPRDGAQPLGDDGIQVFLTGSDVDTASPSSASGVELRSVGKQSKKERKQRPDLVKIVDGVFKHGVEESVGVLVCGPEQMAKKTREAVRPWVMKGRKVEWHNESFGW